MTDRFTSKLLIPAAGFGKRLGSPKAKELLELKTESLPLIEWSLSLAKTFGMPAVVISREDKVELNAYLHSKMKDYPIEICLISDSKEWPDTLLQSESKWAATNIVILPDTRFQPVEIINDLHRILQIEPYAFATFQPDDFSAWGVIRTSKEGSYISEKPKVWDTNDKVWGLFGFQKSYGQKILNAMLSSQGEFVTFSKGRSQLLPLKTFNDLGRSGMDLFKS